MDLEIRLDELDNSGVAFFVCKVWKIQILFTLPFFIIYAPRRKIARKSALALTH